jgi:hypothetical protein
VVVDDAAEVGELAVVVCVGSWVKTANPESQSCAGSARRRLMVTNGPAPPKRSGPGIKERSPDATTTLQPLQIAARVQRDALKNKAYRAFPIGQEAGTYLRQNRGRLLPNTYTTYESCLDKLARNFCDLELSDFEPPIGTERLEKFIDEEWGAQSARTRAKNISIIKGFFDWAVLRGKLHGDPARPIRPPKKRGVHRETFSHDERMQIVADGPDPEHLFRDRCALRLLPTYATRKDSLRQVQFRHFDHNRRRLTIFTKGAKVRTLPIVEAGFWDDLGRHIIEWEAQPDDYLLCRRTLRPNRHKAGEKFVVEYRTEPMGGRPRSPQVVVPLSPTCRHRRRGDDVGQKDAHGEAHRRPPCSTRPATSKQSRNCWATRRSARPATSTPTGTSTSSSRRCARS